MTILSRYIFRTIMLAVLLVLLIVVSIDTIFKIVNQLDELGQRFYNISAMFTHILLTLPKAIYEYYPISTLIGVIIGLGGLANNSELTVMRASGISIGKISAYALVPVFALMIVVLTMAEFVMPVSNNLAEAIKYETKYGHSKLTRKNVWFRVGQDIIHIDKIQTTNQLKGVVRYHFRKPFDLYAVTYASSARFDQVRGQWVLSDIKKLFFDKQGAVKATYPDEQWQTPINPQLVEHFQVEPNTLSMRDLWLQINYLKENKLDSAYYSLAFWQKALQPLTIIVMVFLAIPFVLGSTRSQTMGKRVVTGITIGFTFFLFTQIFGPLAVLYNVPAVLAAISPSLVFLVLSIYLLVRWKFR